MTFRRVLSAWALLAGIFVARTGFGDVKLPSVFSDHMVLQRDLPVAVWGWADPGEEIKIAIAGQTNAATADRLGQWRVKFDKLSAPEAVTLTVSGKNTVIVEDVLIGEVWLASGQSNMQLPVGSVTNAWLEKTRAKFPQIRMFTVARHVALTPQTNCEGKWVICSPETVGNFSAAAYFFGRDLHEKLGMPVGIINASWGGTPIETWISMPVQAGKKEFEPAFKSWEAKMRVPYNEEKAQAQYARQLVVWTNVSLKLKAAGKQPPGAPPQPVAPRLNKNYPANLFNGMIAPIIPYTIRGGIWYQGENNAQGESASLYASQLPLLIQDWRTRWAEGDFPFAWVQLPNFRKRTDDPGATSDWALMRESMLRALSVTNTGMATTIDVGDPTNIHPKDKQTVGHRLALWALVKVYGEKGTFCGPLPASHTINDNEVVLSFTHTDGGLTARGGELKGFAIAGADHKWSWANARIANGQVRVSSPDVKSPVAVRYAWADNPDCNLYNGVGLPASPFRTDNW